MLDHRIPCVENFTVDMLQIRTEVDQSPSLWMGEVKHLKSKTTVVSSSFSILDCWASEGLMSIIEIFTHIAWMVIQSFLTWIPCWSKAQLQRPSSYDNIGGTFTFPTFENQVIFTSLVLCKFKPISNLNPLNPELNPILYLLALLGAHNFLHVSRIRVKLLTFRLLMSYIYGAPILDVSRSHTTTQHSR